MHQNSRPDLCVLPPPSPLMLCDRLITLAQDADSAGCGQVAGRLVELAHAVLERPPANGLQSDAGSLRRSQKSPPQNPRRSLG